MDPQTMKEFTRQIPQREETFPVQEQELFPVGDTLRVRCASQSAALILAEQLAESPIRPAIVAPVFVP